MFPVHTIENWILTVSFETERDFVESQLLEGIELASKPPVAVVWCLEARFTTLGGPHRESAIGVIVKFEGKEYLYPLIVYLGPTTEEFFAAGREVWGHQKKLARSGISLQEGSGIVTGFLERPEGSRLMEISVGPLEREATAEELGFLPVLSLRVIPHPERAVPQLAELTVTELEMAPRKSGGHLDFWAGSGQVAYPTQSDRDPLYRFPVSRVLGGYYGCYERIIAPLPRIVKQLVP